MRVLVAYATCHGATAGIAARIAARLGRGGLVTDLRRVEEVSGTEDYDAVVLGAPVYDQAWPPEADRFLEANREALAAVPVWLFSVGSFSDTKPLIGQLMRREPRHIAEIQAAVEPREYRVFQGVIHRRQWPPWSRLFFHLLGGRFGDHRDWPAIDTWSERILSDLTVR